MKRVLPILLCLLMFSSSVNAADFGDISCEAKEEYITKLADKISKDLGLQTTPKLYFYHCAEWPVMASYYDGLDYIYVNLDSFANTQEATTIMAHELRHDYQYEHMNDDTEYGKAVRENKQNYISYYNNLDGYYNQFVEVDATEFAETYLKKCFK